MCSCAPGGTCDLSLGCGRHDTRGHCTCAAEDTSPSDGTPGAWVGGKGWLKSGPDVLPADQSSWRSDPLAKAASMTSLLPGQTLCCLLGPPLQVIRGRLGDCPPSSAPSPVPQGLAFKTQVCPQAGARSWGHCPGAGERPCSGDNHMRDGRGQPVGSVGADRREKIRQRLGKVKGP